MRRTNLYAAVAVVLTLLAVPALGQNFSDGYTFLKGVRERDAAKVNDLVARPNPAIRVDGVSGIRSVNRPVPSKTS